MRVGVINNLRAGRSRKQVGRIRDLLLEHPEVAHVETQNAGALPDAIAALSRRQVDLLVLNGGDGTLQHALTEILAEGPFERVPLVAPLRGGRTNMTALDLGADRDPVRGLAAVLQAAREGNLASRIVDRPVLRATFDSGRRVQYGMFFGAGMIDRAVALTLRVFPQGRSQGVFGAGLVTFALIARSAFRSTDGVLTPDKVQIILDGELVPQGEFYLTIASTLNRLFLRLNPFWGREEAPVRFTCIASDARRIGSRAPGILWGRPPAGARPDEGYVSRNVERAQLWFGGGFTIDGESFACQSDELVSLAADRRVRFVRA